MVAEAGHMNLSDKEALVLNFMKDQSGLPLKWQTRNQ